MRTARLTILTVAAALALGACSSSASPAAPSVAVPSVAIPSVAIPSVAVPSETAVAISGFAFVAPAITVSVGTKVTWTNTDPTAHTVTFDDSSITGSGNLPTGATFDNTFTKAGTFTYHCKIHSTMTGTVTVS